LAKENADLADDSAELRKRLWLQIARHVIEEEGDVKSAIAFISKTDTVKIEDILPFFPDFTLIDDFKEAICRFVSARCGFRLCIAFPHRGDAHVCSMVPFSPWCVLVHVQELGGPPQAHRRADEGHGGGHPIIRADPKGHV
jgi:hypothetical protein